MNKVKEFPYRPEFRQFNRRNNEIIAACYALYLTGKSVRYIAQTHYHGRFTHQALWGQFKVRGYKLRSKKLGPSRTYKGRIFRADKCGLYRSRVGGKAIYLHRLIWEESNGSIPKDHVVFFKDGNKENITIGNLVCMHREDAKKLYNNSNQFGYKRFNGKGAFGL